MKTTNEGAPPKKKQAARFSLSKTAMTILAGWHFQVREKYPGIKISYADLASWYISRQREILSDNDTAEIEAQFFDSVRRLEWMLAEARAAKARVEIRPFSVAPSTNSVKLSQ